MLKDYNVKYGLTHAGKFHADDVFGAALLRIVYPKMKIQRSFEVPEDFDGVVFDIGFGEYDHHQADKEVRENGVPYAAFGLLWRELGPSLVGEEEAKRFDEKFVQPLDLSDNTGCSNPIAEMIGNFNPGWDEKVPIESRFWEACGFAKKILLNHISKVKGFERAKDIVRDYMNKCDEKSGILVLDTFVPWKQEVCGSNYHVVVYPSKRGGFSAQIVPISADDNTLSAKFPEEWYGKTSEELREISGIETFNFCHATGFMTSCGTLEDAMKVAKSAKW